MSSPNGTIERAWVNAYNSNIQLAFQQLGSRLRRICRVEMQNAEYEYYDRLGTVTAREITTRHGNTEYDIMTHDRRRVGLREWETGALIDKRDKIRSIADFTSPYVQTCGAALNRAVDDVIIAAFESLAYTGKNGETQVTAANDGLTTLAANVNSEGAAFTVAKLRRAKTLLEEKEVIIEDPKELFIVCRPDAVEDLLRSTRATSSDYNSVKTLVNGSINSFHGFEFIKTNRLPAGIAFAVAKNAVLLAMGQEIQTMVDVLPERRHNTQIRCVGSFGATRLWGEMIVKIPYTAGDSLTGASQ